MIQRRFSRLTLFAVMLLTACADQVERAYPVDPELERVRRRGKLTGDGLLISGGDEENRGSDSGSSPIGVNSFLWRATLDSIAFMPLASADPFGGVIITDWYADPATPDERVKLNILILDRQLRADGIKVTAFRQQLNDATGQWLDAPTNASTARAIEDTILTRARELRRQQSMK